MRLTKLFITLFFILLITAVNSGAYAQFQPTELAMDVVTEGFLVPDGTADSPAGLVVTLTLNLEPEWYTYSNTPGEMGKPTIITGTTADGKEVVPYYPIGKDKPDLLDPSVLTKTYPSGTKLFVFIPDGTADSLPVALRLELLLCHPTKCVPARLELSYGEGVMPNSLPNASEQPWWPKFTKLSASSKASASEISDDKTTSTIIDWEFTPTYLAPGLEVSSLVSAIFMGLLAGLILNIMPCVLPVVSLKLTALLNANLTGHKDPLDAFREHNIYFVLGVLSFFLLLAIILGATGSAWGALFQHRWLVLGMAALVMTLGASLFGFFHLPVIDLKFGAGHANPKTQSFFTGMLTTLLATPCSGPFLGGVLGWALIQGPAIIATVFISIGLGMSSPYLLLIINPKLARYLPRSGPWIQYVEKAIGFFLIGTAFYLIAIAMGIEWLQVLAPLWVILFGGWLWVQTRGVKQSFKWGIRISVIILLGLSVLWTTPTKLETNPWETFDPVTLNELIGKETLFVDFTADWCPTCKVLEATVLTDINVATWKKDYGIRFIKVDMTERDPEKEALLLALGSRSLPTAAVFQKGAKSSSPTVLRDLFTTDQVEKILRSL